MPIPLCIVALGGFIGGCILGAALGYGIGRLDWVAAILFDRPEILPPEPIVKRRAAVKEDTAAPTAAIDINDKTVVVPIDISGIQRGNSLELGKTSLTDDNIATTAQRLADLKGK